MLRRAMVLRQLVECVAIAEVVYFYMNDDGDTLHGKAWEVFQGWRDRRRAIRDTMDMIDGLPVRDES